MKTLIFTLCLTCLMHYHTFAQSEFVLEPSQNMLMTGKGAGQDATINPYYGQDCYAIVENMGAAEFSIRIQQKGKIIDTIAILENETIKVKLLKGQELYLDSNPEEIVKVKLDYKEIEPKR